MSPCYAAYSAPVQQGKRYGAINSRGLRWDLREALIRVEPAICGNLFGRDETADFYMAYSAWLYQL